MTAVADVSARWTVSRAVGALATLAALVIALGPAYPLTLLLTLATGVFAVVVAVTIHRENPVTEFITSFTLPLFGLLIVLTPAIAVYETHGIVLEPMVVFDTVVLGIAAAVAAAVVFPIAAGGYRPTLPRATLSISGQLIVPLGLAVFLVYMLERQRLLEAAPRPAYLYNLLVFEPAQSGEIAPLVITAGLVWILVGLIGVLLSRPLEYGWLFPEEPEGQILQRLARVFYGLSFAIVITGWFAGFLVLLETRPGVSYPAGVWLFIDTLYGIAVNESFVRLIMNMLLVYAAGALLISPLYVYRWVERTNTLWLIRHVFSGALALIIGLSAAFLVRQAILASRSTVEAMDESGDLAWTIFDWLPVLFTGLPFVGILVIFGGSLLYVYLFEREFDAYPQYIGYRNVGVGALFFVSVLAVAGGTPTIYGLLAAGGALLAWDTFEYSYTLRTELPAVGRVGANELVHVAGITALILGGIVVAILGDLLLSPLATNRDGVLLATLFFVLATVAFLFALRE